MKKYLPLIVLACLALLPLFGLSSYTLHLIILVFMWATVGMAWNLLAGFCGQVSFGHAAFFGVGAYTAGILYYHNFNISSWWGIPISIVVVAIFSFLLGLIVLRLRGPFFTLATLATGEIMRVIAENLVGFTGGDTGILMERTWVEKTNYYFIALAIAVMTYLVVKTLMQSRLGYYFVAIREDQDAAESLGVNTTLYKTIALCISGALTGVAGAFYFNYMGLIDPKTVFSLPEISTFTIMIVMVGGVATYFGPFVGAVIMVLLAEVVRSYMGELAKIEAAVKWIPGLGAAHLTFFGILLILIIIFLPNGIVGGLQKIKLRFNFGGACK